MRDLVETCFHVSLDDTSETSVHHLLTAEDRVVRVSIGPKPVRSVVKLNLIPNPRINSALG